EAHRQSPPPRRLRKRIRSQGPFLRRNYPASQVVRPCPTPARSAAKHTASKPRPPTARVSPDYPHHPSTVPCPLPRWIERVHLSIASPSTRPSPLFRRVGIHIFTFEACSGFTHVTARWIAQPPKAAFVTRLRPGQSPSQTARQLPDQSTTLWVESSSTGDTRLRNAQNKSKLYVQDVTLRDGMHSIRHQYHLESVRDIARALDRAKVDAIEICHGDGITGSTFNYGFGAHDDGEWIDAVAAECNHARVTVLLIPGIGTVHDLKGAYDRGARSVRIATHCTEADVSRQHIEAALKLGMDTVGFLMMAHMAPTAKLVEQAKLMESYGAECVYVTDSAGALLPAQYAERVTAFR